MSEELQFPWTPEELAPAPPPPKPADLVLRMEWPEPTPREKFELRAMKHFNRRREFWMHLVDAGELGILLLDQALGGRWEKSWIELEKIPAPAPEPDGEKKGGEGHE